jgi:hypothetical protein
MLAAVAGASALDVAGETGASATGAVEAGAGVGAGAGGSFLPQALSSRAPAKATLQSAPERGKDVMQVFMGTPLSITWRRPVAGVASAARLARRI